MDQMRLEGPLSQSHLVWIMGKVTWTRLGRIYYFSTIFFSFCPFLFPSLFLMITFLKEILIITF